MTRAKPVPTTRWKAGDEHDVTKSRRHSTDRRINDLERGRTHRRTSIAMEASEYFKAARNVIGAKKTAIKAWYILDPLSDAIKRWDLITAIALLFTAVAPCA